MENDSAKLYIVATPIGNMEDVTLRALRILEEADVIAAEDTRVTGKLLARYEIKKPMLSLHQHNELAKAQVLIERIQGGESIAFCTDAGTPALSDPGANLVDACRQAGIDCVPIPGPSALAAAISASGMDTTRFVFEGFLPASGSERKKRLAELKDERRTIILYESPHRLQRTLHDTLETWGDRGMAIAREVTKLHEQFARCTIGEAIELFEEPKGEFVLLFEGDQSTAEIDYAGAEKRMAELIESGMKRRQAAAQVAGEFGISKNEAYEILSFEGN